MKMNQKLIFSIFLIFIIPVTSFAYVGPGAGISFLGALWAVITAIVLAVGGFLAWPIRNMMRKRKLKKQVTNPDSEKPTK